MKVFLYVTSLAMGGAEQQCCRLAVALKRQYGYDVEVIVTYAKKSNWQLADSLSQAKIPVHECLWKSPAGLFRMYRLFRNAGKGAALFCYNAFPDFWGGLIGSMAGLKKIYGGVRGEFLPRLNLAMDRFAQRHLLNGLIFNSYRGCKRFGELGFLTEKSLVISNSIPSTSHIHKYTNDIEKRITIITVGVFKWEKDYGTWIKTFSEVRKQHANVQGVIIGYGNQEGMVRQLISDNHLNDVIAIINGNKAKDIPERLASADIYLATSVLEGTSNSIMEGLRAGIPVVATDVGDNSYLIQEGESGYICPVKDVAALSQAVVKLCKDAALRQRMGERAKARMRTHHSIEHIVSQYKELIDG